MISVEQARKLVLGQEIPAPQTEIVPIHRAGGRFLANDLKSPVFHPPFDQSAMDGYVIRHEDFEAGQRVFEVSGVTAAGDAPASPDLSGKAWRIFTGAAVPLTGDTMIIQEDTVRDGEQITLTTDAVGKGQNIRFKGEQLSKGDLAFESGQEMDAPCIALLASMGIGEIEVSARPKVGMVVSGSEFATDPADLEQGKIFESNGVMLQVALEKTGIEAEYEKVEDDPDLMKEKIGKSVAENQVTLVTGGVSVGEKDFTRSTLESLGFEVIFHKVAQKPGKPLLFMRKGDQFAFGLPGNPRSSLICFYVYVWPLLRKIQGAANPDLIQLELTLLDRLRWKPGRSGFLTGSISENGILPMGAGQGSHMLKSFADSNALLYVPGEMDNFEEGSPVKVFMLP